MGGIYNWLNVIAKLIPDSILTEKWEDQETVMNLEDKTLVNKLHKKLNRLCQLASSELSYTLTDKAPNYTLTFSYLTKPYFDLGISPTHYRCRLLKAPSADWRVPYYHLDIENL